MKNDFATSTNRRGSSVGRRAHPKSSWARRFEERMPTACQKFDKRIDGSIKVILDPQG
jgi:hypothetical protein